MQFVLPNPQHMPTFAPQRICYQPVSLFIPQYFSAPVFPIVDRLPKMFWASVPEAAIHKNSQTMFRKSKIGIAEQVKIPSPARNSISAEDTSEFGFCGFVSFGFNRSHDLRPLSL